jgi:hypothetical protein
VGCAFSLDHLGLDLSPKKPIDRAGECYGSAKTEIGTAIRTDGVIAAPPTPSARFAPRNFTTVERMSSTICRINVDRSEAADQGSTLVRAPACDLMPQESTS